MKNKNPLAVLLTLLLCILGVSAVANDQPPNIVFFLADDLGWGDLSCYGHPDAYTPVLDQLAAEGTRFESFHVAGVTCSPSRTAFMTGRHAASYEYYPRDFGIDDQMTITELLAANGYTCGHFGKWHIGKTVKDGTYGISDIEELDDDRVSADGRDATLVGEALDFIENNKDNPFYVNVWGHVTHFEVDPVNAVLNKFDAATGYSFSFNRADYPLAWHQAIFDDSQAIINQYGLPGGLSAGMKRYVADVWSMDYNIGRILAKLDELGLSENTIVIFSSDQGPDFPSPLDEVSRDNAEYHRNMLGTGGKFSGGKHSQLEGGIRTPFIIRWPGYVPANKVNTSSVISSLDVLPTLCYITGTDIDMAPMRFDGLDVTDIWLGSDRSPDRPLFFKASGSISAGPAMIEGKWKLHRKRRNDGPVELYNLATDPAELNDVSASNPGIVDNMISQLDDWLTTIPELYYKRDTPLKSPANPVADAGPNQTVTGSVTLDGTGSHDVDGYIAGHANGYIAGYIWRKGTQIVAYGRQPTITLPAGTHTLTLEVSDYDENTGTDTVTITVLPGSGTAPHWAADTIYKSGATSGVPYDAPFKGNLDDDPEGHTPTFTTLSGPVWMDFTSGRMVGTPPQGGVFTWEVEAKDPDGEDTLFIQLTVEEGAPDKPVISIVTIQDGGEGGDNPKVKLILTGESAIDFPVSLSFSGSAIKDADYTSGTLQIFAAGQTSKNVTLTLIDDLLAEGLENVTVTIDLSDDYIVDDSNGSATVIITDNDVPEKPVLSLNKLRDGLEGGANPTDNPRFEIVRTGMIDDAITVSFSFSGTAVLDDDFASGTARSFAAGATSKLVTLTLLDDLLVEGSEDIVVSIVASPDYDIDPAAGVITLNIADND